MAYVFQLEEYFSTTCLKDDDGTLSINFVLGYDFDAYEVVAMSVVLIPEGTAYELCFGIRRIPLSSSALNVPLDYDSGTSKRYVPKGESGRVLRCVLIAIGYLIAHVYPTVIIMETFHENLSPKAMTKYRKIEDIFRYYGYQIVRFRGSDGKDYWAFGRDS
jgi:hypothetical protein